MDNMGVLARATLDHYGRINGLVASAGGFIDPINGGAMYNPTMSRALSEPTSENQRTG
jgi:hypothetical protein